LPFHLLVIPDVAQICALHQPDPEAVPAKLLYVILSSVQVGLERNGDGLSLPGTGYGHFPGEVHQGCSFHVDFRFHIPRRRCPVHQKGIFFGQIPVHQRSQSGELDG
jgi:hypothetical protein